MLDKRYIRENFEFIKKKIDLRGADIDLDAFTQNDEERREILRKIEELRHKKNVVSEKIGLMIKNKDDASELIREMKGVSEDIKQLEEIMKFKGFISDREFYNVLNINFDDILEQRETEKKEKFNEIK
ncbi:MAG: hypothetical protein ACMUHX_08485, partial [bacterium]